MLISPSTLIFGESGDIHVTAVLSKLSDSTVPLLIDFSRFGKDFVATYVTHDGKPICSIRDKLGNSFVLDSVEKVWWRRPQPFLPDEILGRNLQHYVAEECRCFWGGVLSSISGATWFNHYDRHRIIDRKLTQLNIATQAGFKIPDTCVTSDKVLALKFLEKHSYRAIYKSFSGSEDFWQPTRPYLKEYERHLACLVACPVIFQELIDAECEYRVTVINDRVFVARKETRKSRYKYDTRIDCALRHEVSSLPLEIEKQLLRFMEFAEIRFGAFDLILSTAGEIYFIEINPAGQFLYIEEETGMDISEAMGAALSSEQGCVIDSNHDTESIDLSCTENIFAHIVEHRVSHIKSDA